MEQHSPHEMTWLEKTATTTATTKHNPLTIAEALASFGTSLLRVNRGVVVKGHRHKPAKLLELYEVEMQRERERRSGLALRGERDGGRTAQACGRAVASHGRAEYHQLRVVRSPEPGRQGLASQRA